MKRSKDLWADIPWVCSSCIHYHIPRRRRKNTGVSTFYLLPRDRSWCAHILELIFSIWLILFRFFFLSLFKFYSQLKIWWSHALESKLRVLMLALCAQLGSKLKSTADRRQRTEEREKKNWKNYKIKPIAYYFVVRKILKYCVNTFIRRFRTSFNVWIRTASWITTTTHTHESKKKSTKKA